MVLTPQILTPSDDHHYCVDEKGFLATGVYNLGFKCLNFLSGRNHALYICVMQTRRCSFFLIRSGLT
jgi:hypothetical protein